MQLAEYLNKSGIPYVEFAKKLGVSKSLVSHWIAGRRFPCHQNAIAIERATGGKVPKYELRPDIWTRRDK